MKKKPTKKNDSQKQKLVNDDVVKIKFVVDNSSDAYSLLDQAGKLHYVNKSLCRMLGYKEQELLSLHAWDVDIVSDSDEYTALFDAVQKDNVPPVERICRKKDGKTFIARIAAEGYTINDGSYLFVTHRAITRRTAEEEAVLSIARGLSPLVGKEFFYSLTQNLSHILKADCAFIAEFIPEQPDRIRTLSLLEMGNIVDNIELGLKGLPCERINEDNICSYPANVLKLFPHAQKMVDMNIEGFVSKLLYSASNKRLGIIAVMYREPVDHPSLIESTLVIFAARAAAEIERRQYEAELIKSNTELEDRVKERTRELGKKNEELKDKIAKLEITRNALNRSEKRFRAVAESTTDLIWEGDIRTNSLHWFGDIDGILGYEIGGFPRTIEGHLENIHPDDLKLINQAVKKSLSSGEDFIAEYRVKCKDGSYRYWVETGRPIEYENDMAVKWVGAVTDNTQRWMNELTIYSSEAKYRQLSQEFTALLNAIPENLILLSPDLRIQWANKSFARKFGRKYSSLKGKHCYKQCCSISSPCKNCPVILSFKTGREESTRIMNTEGKVFDKRAIPIKDSSGNVKHVIEIAKDVTAEVHLEEEAKLAQSRLIHANKMTSLGTLVSGVAHEVNNPNSFIMNNAQVFTEIWEDALKILDKNYGKDKSMILAGIPYKEIRKVAPKLLDGINDGALRIKNIVDNLKNFSRPDKSHLDNKVDINTVIMTSSSILNNQIKKFTRSYKIKCQDKLPPIQGSAQQIGQVVINLIMNALQSLPDKTTGVSVYTRYNKKTDSVEIKVQDEGVGISKEIADRVTEPFFTTRVDAGGTGLGLAISYAIIKQHRGTLTIKSKEGRGTTVTVQLPLYRNNG